MSVMYVCLFSRMSRLLSISFLSTMKMLDLELPNTSYRFFFLQQTTKIYRCKAKNIILYLFSKFIFTITPFRNTNLSYSLLASIQYHTNYTLQKYKFTKIKFTKVLYQQQKYNFFLQKQINIKIIKANYIFKFESWRQHSLFWHWPMAFMPNHQGTHFYFYLNKF